jgi:hypothetical protein
MPQSPARNVIHDTTLNTMFGPFRAGGFPMFFGPQGDALGWHVSALSGRNRIGGITRITFGFDDGRFS